MDPNTSLPQRWNQAFDAFVKDNSSENAKKLEKTSEQVKQELQSTSGPLKEKVGNVVLQKLNQQQPQFVKAMVKHSGGNLQHTFQLLHESDVKDVGKKVVDEIWTRKAIEQIILDVKKDIKENTPLSQIKKDINTLSDVLKTKEFVLTKDDIKSITKVIDGAEKQNRRGVFSKAAIDPELATACSEARELLKSTVAAKSPAEAAATPVETPPSPTSDLGIIMARAKCDLPTAQKILEFVDSMNFPERDRNVYRTQISVALGNVPNIQNEIISLMRANPDSVDLTIALLGSEDLKNLNDNEIVTFIKLMQTKESRSSIPDAFVKANVYDSPTWTKTKALNDIGSGKGVKDVNFRQDQIQNFKAFLRGDIQSINNAIDEAEKQNKPGVFSKTALDPKLATASKEAREPLKQQSTPPSTNETKFPAAAASTPVKSSRTPPPPLREDKKSINNPTDEAEKQNRRGVSSKAAPDPKLATAGKEAREPLKQQSTPPSTNEAKSPATAASTPVKSSTPPSSPTEDLRIIRERAKCDLPTARKILEFVDSLNLPRDRNVFRTQISVALGNVPNIQNEIISIILANPESATLTIKILASPDLTSLNNAEIVAFIKLMQTTESRSSIPDGFVNVLLNTFSARMAMPREPREIGNHQNVSEIHLHQDQIRNFKAFLKSHMSS